MLNKLRSGKESGFSLLEAMIAMVVLAVGLIALGQLVAVAVSQNAMSRTTSVGITVAQGKLEELRTEYNAGLNSGVTSANVLAGGHGPETVMLPSGYGTETRNYLVTWEVNDVSGSEKNINVTVQPQQGSFLNSRSVTISSHFAP